MAVIPLGNMAQEELIQKNGTADELANFVSQYFFSSLSLPDGSTIGGKEKMAMIKAGDPGFRVSATQDPLAQLIADLFSLLKEHYDFIDMASLSDYARPQYEGPLPLEDDPVIGRKVKPKKSTSEPSSPDGVNGIADAPASTSASLAPVSAPSDRPSRRTLNDHEAIIQIFERAFEQYMTRANSLAKTADQFLGLRAFDPVAPQKVSGSIRKSSDASAGQDSERMAKKPRIDSQAPLDSVAEEGS